jgi:hypothetical protein
MTNGGAINNGGILTLQSCIFSDNLGQSGGGAVYSTSPLTVFGCTFYNNAATGTNSEIQGGAIRSTSNDNNLTLTGNLFYGNTAKSGYNAVRKGGNSGTTSSYNVLDLPFGINSTESGFVAGTGDVGSISGLPVSPITFKRIGTAAAARLPATLPAGYPTKDFYGQPIIGGGAAGAVQAAVSGSGYSVVTTVNDSGDGTLAVSGTTDADGLYSGAVTITATPAAKYSVGEWLVNGVTNAQTGNTLTITPTAHTTVKAVFIRTVTVFTDGAATVEGTLRYALTGLRGGDIIRFIGVTPGTTTISLTSVLPVIYFSAAGAVSTNIIIEGNGVTLTRGSGYPAAGEDTQLLVVYNDTPVIKISGIHFKGGSVGSSGHGAAIKNAGKLTLESCIFSGNEALVYLSCGGAIYSTNTLTIAGCTFYQNKMGMASGDMGQGAAVYITGSGKVLTLIGNLFYGNESNRYPVVYAASSATVTSGGGNVTDVVYGTGTAASGWTARTASPADKAFNVTPSLGITGDPFYTTAGANYLKPLSANMSALQIIPATTAGFPATDFGGATRSGTTVPGAWSTGQ